MRQAMRPAGNAAAAHTLRGEPKRQRDGADSVVPAISAEKGGNLRVVYARIGRCQGRPLGEVPKLR